MKVHFWGVRGSIPTPLLPSQIQSRIAAVVQRISPADLDSSETRERFIANLPPYLSGTVGGNTTCIEVRLADDTIVVIDAGSGIAALAASLKRRREHVRHYHLFFTHFHWDHIQGLPFFSPQIFDPRCRITFYSPIEGFEEVLRAQMKPPFFPITMDAMTADLRFHVFTEAAVEIGAARVERRKMKHPGGSHSYKISELDKSLIFSTDTELTEEDFRKSDENRAYFENVNLLIMDTQYTLDEAVEKYEWGHSSYSLAVDFATAWSIPTLVLFHHEPAYDDKKMDSILKSSRWYSSHLEGKKLEVVLATEDLEISL